MKSIYRSLDGHTAVRTFATGLLDAWQVEHDRHIETSPLGPTHVLSAGDGPPVVLLAGTNFCAATTLDLLGAIARTHRVHAIDLPGQPGLSHDVRPRRSQQAYGAWLVDLLPRITSTPPLVVGHSLGARVALSGVANNADVAGAVLVDPAGVTWLSVTPRVMRPTIPWLRRPAADTAQALLRMMMAPGRQPPGELTAWMALVGRYVRTSLAPPPLSMDVLRRVAGTDIRVLSGRHDAFLPARRLSRAVSRKLPTASFDLVEDGGHLLPHERPAVVAAAVGELVP